MSLLFSLLLAVTANIAVAEESSEEVDPKVVFCAQVVDDFNFGIQEEEQYHEQTGEYLGTVLSKANAEDDPSVQLDWRRYGECVKYLRQDAWTHAEYLAYATSSHSPTPVCLEDARDCRPPRSEAPSGKRKRVPRSLVLGKQHPVVLAPAKPLFSRYFLVPAYDFVVGSYVKHFGTYDPTEEEVLRNLVVEGDCVVEVGSNIGAYTVVLADQVGQKGLVYAFEPFRKIFQIMNANLALQGYGNVVTRQVGISSARQVVNVRAPGLNDFTNLGAARVFFQQEEEVAHVPFEGMEEIEVETLDGIRINCGQSAGADAGRVDFIKIDAEGLELEVVHGGLKLINEHQPVIYAESQPFFQSGDDTFFRRMTGYGYACSPVKNLEMHEIILCLPRSRLQELTEKLPLLRR